MESSTLTAFSVTREESIQVGGSQAWREGSHVPRGSRKGRIREGKGDRPREDPSLIGTTNRAASTIAVKDLMGDQEDT